MKRIETDCGIGNEKLRTRLSAQTKRACTLPTGTPLYTQGEPLTGPWIIERGFVKLLHLTAEGNKVLINLLGPGAVVGRLLDGEASIALETALTQGSVTVIPLSEALRPRYLLALQTRILYSERRLSLILNRNVKARLSGLLWDLLQTSSEPCNHLGGRALHLHLTHEELADLAGASRPVVSAALSAWKKKRWIEYSREFMCVPAGSPLLPPTKS